MADQLSSSRARLEPALPWLAACWLTGVILLAMRPICGLAAVRKLRIRGLKPLSAELRKRADHLMTRLHVDAVVEFSESALVEVPMLVGYLRPMVLLPASAVTGLSPQQLELILAHELAHVRRHDYLVNLAQTVIEALLFYHPCMWWVSAQARRERENCCDDVAMSICGNRAEYVRALYALESRRQVASPAIAATGGSLVSRVRRLLHSDQAAAPDDRRVPWLDGLIVLALVAAIVSFGHSYAEESSPTPKNVSEPSAADSAKQPTDDEGIKPATIIGRVLYDGAPPKPKSIYFPPRGEQQDGAGRRSIWSDAEYYRKLRLADESLIVGKDGGIANVVVWVRSKNAAALPWSGPLPPSTVRFANGRFDLRVLAFWNVAPLKLVNESDHGTNFNWSAI